MKQKWLKWILSRLMDTIQLSFVYYCCFLIAFRVDIPAAYRYIHSTCLAISFSLLWWGSKTRINQLKEIEALEEFTNRHVRESMSDLAEAVMARNALRRQREKGDDLLMN